MRQMGFAAAFALSCSVTVLSAAPQVVSAPAQRSGDDLKEVTITGCVVKGDGGYVLTNVAEETVAAAVAAGTPSTPQPAGTVMPGRVFYLLEDDDNLDEHAGHKVEVQGKLKGDAEKGKVSAERESGLVELEFKADEKKITVKVPNVPPAIGTSGKVGDKEVDFPYIVRRIDVKSVKLITSTCK